MKNFLGIFWIQTLAFSFAHASTAFTEMQPLQADDCRRFASSNPAAFPIQRWKVLYDTIDANGQPTIASGSVVVPANSAQNSPYVVWQHGTKVDREQVPSRGDMESIFAACQLAWLQKPIVMADYIGLGDSPGFHPYMHAATEASAARDLVLAYATREQREHVNLLITGYSQGGHSAAALHRDIEASNDPRISVLASSPMAGPYDPDGSSLRATLDNPEPKASTLYSAYAILSYQDIYGDIFTDPTEVFKPEFASISSIFHSQKQDEIDKALPALPSELFRQEFLETLRTNPNHPFRKHLRDNDLTEWTPRAPIQFVYAGSDKVVPGDNAKVAFAKMSARSNLVSIVNAGEDLNHNTGAFSSFYATLQFFRQQP